MTHEGYMAEALKLAKRGTGFVNPNPLVGAVIVKDGTIIGRGWHKKYGDLHAERNAFADCDARGINCRGADMYVTLEPCCHHGKQPPCTDAIIEHGIKRVFVGSGDPNRMVAGKGIKILREHGIEVVENVLKEECDSINDIFFYWITEKWPFVTAKYAMTLDGKTACFTGESKWITGEEARLDVQYERLKHTAIMVGIGTVLADDPMLTCRIEGGRNPVRVICDSNLMIPFDSKIVQTAKEIPTIIATTDYGKRKFRDQVEKRWKLRELGCEIFSTHSNSERRGVNTGFLLRHLADREIDSVLLEGGGELAYSMFSAGYVKRVKAYIAPKIFGGRTAKTPVSGLGIRHPDDAYTLYDTKISSVGDDYVIEGRVRYKEYNQHGKIVYINK